MNKGNRFYKLISAILLCLIIVGFVTDKSVQAGCETSKFCSVDPNLNFEVETSVVSAWEDFVNVSMCIDNIGDNTIDNWFLTFNTPYTIVDIWDANIYETDGKGTYTIKNNGYNQDINVDSTMFIGMTLYLNGFEYSELSDVYLLNTKVENLNESNYNVSYSEYSKWDNGFSGVLNIKPNCYVEDWAISFKSEYKISSVDNARLKVVGDMYYISNDGYIQNLDGEYAIGIQGEISENEFSLNDMCMTSVGLACSLKDDINNNGVYDYIEYMNLDFETDTSLITPTNQPTDNPVVSLCPTLIPRLMNSIVEVSIGELVFKSNSGIVESGVSATITTDIDITRVWIASEDSKKTVEMDWVDASAKKFNAIIEIDTNIETDTVEIIGYDVLCELIDGTCHSAHFDVFIVRNSDEAYFNTVYSRAHLFNYIDNGHYISDDYDTRKDRLVDILADLEAKGVVEKGSVYANEIGGNVSYRPVGDFFHYIEYKDYDSTFSSAGLGTVSTGNNLIRNGAKLSDSEHYDLLIINGFSDSDNRSGLYNGLKDYFSGEDGDFIQDVKDEYDVELLEPLDVHIVDYPSLEDYMYDLDNGTFTILASHGAVVEDSNISVCCTGLLYDLSDSSEKDYVESLRIQYKDMIWPIFKDDGKTKIELGLSADFFKEFYGEQRSLKNTIVLLDNCFSGYGSDQGALVNAMAYCGAAAVSGYSSEVRSIYEVNYDKECIKRICGGMNFLKAFHESSSGIDEENRILADYIEMNNILPLYHVYHGTKLVDNINDISHNIKFSTLTPTLTPMPTSSISPTNKPTGGVTTTPTEKVKPTSTPIPVVEENDPVDVWFICESSDNFDETKIKIYEDSLDYIFSSGKYFYGRDHIGVGFCTSSGTASTNYTHNGAEYYKNIIATVKGNYVNGSGLLGNSISPIDWFLCSYWSNKINPSNEKLYNSRPECFSVSSYVFFVDSETQGYMDSRFTEEAISCLRQYNIKVFWVNLGTEQLSEEMVQFAEATGGGELSSSPKNLWDELLSFQ